MRLVRCSNGHFYDRDRYSECPNCICVGSTKELSSTPPVMLPSAIPELQAADDNPTDLFPLWSNNQNPYTLTEQENIEALRKRTTEVTTEISRVELFRNYGQIQRRGVFCPDQEKTNVIILNLPISLQTDSIHLLAEDGLISQSMRVFQYTFSRKEELAQNKKELEKLEKESKPLYAQLHMCEMKLNCMGSYMKRQSKWETSHQVFMENITAAEREWNLLSEQQAELSAKVQEVNQKRDALMKKGNELQGEAKQVYGIEFEFCAEPGREYKFCLDYVLNSVKWTPRYDIRTYTRGGELQLLLLAEIHQHSGEDWNDISICLSTENNLPDPQAAQLRTQIVDIKAKDMMALPAFLAENTQTTEDAEWTVSTAPMSEPSEHTTQIAAPLEGMNIAEKSSADEQTNSIQKKFTMSDSVSLGNGDTKTVVLTSKSIQIKKIFFSIPKKECSEYIGVYAEAFKDEKLLDCQARVYIDDTYSTVLKTNQLKESGIIVLGRAYGVTFQRKLLVDEMVNKKLSGQVELHRSYEILVENEMTENASVLVIDQIPVSQHPSIFVTVKNAKNAEVDSAGICRWNVTLKPHEKISLLLEYVVAYPQKEEIVWNM